MFGIIVIEAEHRAFSLDSDVPNDSPVRHRTSEVSIEIVTSVPLISDAVIFNPRTSDPGRSLNSHSISASHTTMVPRPARPVTPQEAENRRKRKIELRRVERERKRRQKDEEKEAAEQQSS